MKCGMRTFGRALVLACGVALTAGAASALTLNFVELTTQSSNTPHTGASGKVEMVFSNLGTGEFKIDFTISNTTGTPVFGDGATESKLTGFGFDILSTSSILSHTLGTVFDTFIQNAALPPFGTVIAAFANDGNFQGGGPQGALPQGQSESGLSVTLSDSNYADAAALKTAMALGFGNGDLDAVMRFQDVNAGEGSDKLKYIGLGGPGDVTTPVPVPAAMWLLLTALGGLGLMRLRRS